MTPTNYVRIVLQNSIGVGVFQDIGIDLVKH